MALMDVFRKKKEVELPTPQFPAPGPAARTELPSDLERLRMSQPAAYQPAPAYAPPPEPTFSPPPASTDGKLDLIISKLETIDARLRVLEEKIERKGSTPSPSLMF
jgi:hypothetical protein